MTAGAPDFEKRANEIARTILKEHKPEPLPEDVGKALDKLVRDVMKQLEK
jgi:trimethylamine:corrinoid methyltransferase-like protein